MGMMNSSGQQAWLKPLRFGLLGAAGCFVLALLVGEPLLLLAMPPPPPPPPPSPRPETGPPPPVDVMFLLDVTGSMQREIDGVCTGIAKFAEELSKRALDARVGLIAFRDRLEGEEPEVLTFQDGPFTNDFRAFSKAVGRLRASGGGDEPESSLDALVLGAQQPFRPRATRVLLLITDAPPKLPDKETRSVAEASEYVRQKGIQQLHLVVNDHHRQLFAGLWKGAPGEFFSLREASRGRGGFERILPVLGERIAETTIRDLGGLKSLQASTGFDEGSLGRLLLAVCLWTAVLALGVSLALIAGQNQSLRRSWLTAGEAVQGAAGSLVAGALAGAAGQLLFQQIGSGSPLWVAVSRVVGWAILGGLLGVSMAFFVRNLNGTRALLGGALGGAAGALGFLVMSAGLGDMAGRLLGAAVLGFAIGLMVALVEMAFRKAWLEIVYGPNEVGTVNLGDAPVSVGGDMRACTVWARGAAPVALRYQLRSGKVLCEDVVRGQSTYVSAGDRQRVGAVEVVVRGLGAEPPAAVPVPAAPAPPVAVPSPDRPYPAAQAAPAAKPVSPDRPYPVPPATKPIVATPPTAGGCPGCGRKAPGTPGKRFCVICERAY